MTSGNLPPVMARAVERWGITLGVAYADAHPGNLVYRCTLPDGTHAVIKTEPERTGDDEFFTGLDALKGMPAAKSG